MLVIVSDIHLTDKTTARNVHATAFELLCSEIAAAAKGKRATEIQVVLLGDILDLVRTDYWHRTTSMEQRPWGGTLDPATGMNLNTSLIEKQFAEVLRGVLNTVEGQSLLDLLNTRIEAATSLKPVVTYVIGNHDRVFNNFPSLKDIVKSALPGVASFRFDNLYRSDEYGVFARHGHEWDDNCHGFKFYNEVLRGSGSPALGRFDPGIYRVMAIGEVVTAELMSGLVHYARSAQPSGTPEWSHFIEGFKDLNNLRPTTDVFGWLDWFARDQQAAYKPALHTALRKSLDGVLKSSLALQWDRLTTDLLVKGDLTDRLAFLRNHVLGDSFDQFSARVKSVSKVQELAERFSSDSDDYTEGADTEWQPGGGSSAGTQYVLYGHTHHARNITLSARTAGPVRMYINTGTMLPLIQRTRSRDGFSNAGQMTIAFFYRHDEDKEGRADLGPTVDVWNGIRRKNYS